MLHEPTGREQGEDGAAVDGMPLPCAQRLDHLWERVALWRVGQDRLTQVASHEFAELTTDPQLNAWYDPGAGENGDICNGQSDAITVGANTWTVQRIYSKYDDEQSGGATICSSQATNPLPAV